MEEQWAVINFSDDNSVAIIPKFWLMKGNNDEDMSYWPPNTKNASLIVKKREKPTNIWPQYKVKIMGIYDNFEIASKKCVMAEETSDLGSDLSSFESPRIRQKNRKYKTTTESEASIDCGKKLKEKNPSLFNTFMKKKLPNRSSSSEDEQQGTDSDDEIIPVFPASNKKNEKKEKSMLPSQEQEKTTEKENKHEHFTCSAPLASSPHVLMQTTSTQPVVDIDFKRQVLTKLNLILAKLSTYDDHFELLEKNMGEKKDTNDENEILEVLLNMLPVDTDEKLEELENFLSSKEKQTLLSKEMSRIGGATVKEITKKIMYRIISNEFGQLYSWEGGKGKRKFINLAITKVIFDAVVKNVRTKDACHDEIIAVIKSWLVKAKERSTNMRKRMVTAQERNE